MPFTEFLKSAKDFLKTQAPPETSSPERVVYLQRILGGQITPEDEFCYQESRLERAISQPEPSFFGPSPELLGGWAVLAEQKRLEELSEEKLHKEMKKYAQEEAGKLGLNLTS